MDIKMPGVDGISAAEPWPRALTPVLLLTAYSDKESSIARGTLA